MMDEVRDSSDCLIKPRWLLRRWGVCLLYKAEKRGCLAATNIRLVLNNSYIQLAGLVAANVLLWGWGSLPQLLSWSITALEQQLSQNNCQSQRTWAARMLWMGHEEDPTTHHPTTVNNFNIPLLHLIFFILKEEGDQGIKINHVGEIPAPLSNLSPSSNPGKREGLTFLCASAQPQWTYVNSPEQQAMPGRADFLLFPSFISFKQKFCLDWENFSHRVPTKSFSYNEQVFIRKEEKVFYWRILDQSPLSVLQQGPDSKIPFKKKQATKHMPLPNFFFVQLPAFPSVRN